MSRSCGTFIPADNEHSAVPEIGPKAGAQNSHCRKNPTGQSDFLVAVARRYYGRKINTFEENNGI